MRAAPTPEDLQRARSSPRPYTYCVNRHCGYRPYHLSSLDETRGLCFGCRGVYFPQHPTHDAPGTVAWNRRRVWDREHARTTTRTGRDPFTTANRMRNRP